MQLVRKESKVHIMEMEGEEGTEAVEGDKYTLNPQVKGALKLFEDLHLLAKGVVPQQIYAQLPEDVEERMLKDFEEQEHQRQRHYYASDFRAYLEGVGEEPTPHEYGLSQEEVKEIEAGVITKAKEEGLLLEPRAPPGGLVEPPAEPEEQPPLTTEETLDILQDLYEEALAKDEGDRAVELLQKMKEFEEKLKGG